MGKFRLSLLAFPISNRDPASGPSRSHPPPVTLYSLSDVFFVFCFSSQLAMPKVVSRAAVSTSQDGPWQPSYCMLNTRPSSDSGSFQPNPLLRQSRTSAFTVRIKLISSSTPFFDTKRKKTASVGSTSYVFVPFTTSRAQYPSPPRDHVVVDHRQGPTDPSKTTDRWRHYSPGQGYSGVSGQGIQAECHTNGTNLV